MTKPPSLSLLYDVIDATWPAADTQTVGPWTIRQGNGGGSRVSATSARASVTADDIPIAETAMDALGQPHLFMIRNGDDVLDALLAQRGYIVKDPVTVYLITTAELATQKPPLVTTFAVWEPLEIMKTIWQTGGIGPERLAVMGRASHPKTGLFGRVDDTAAASGYVAGHGSIAMLHALEVLPDHRRKGLGVLMMRQAAFWAQQHGLEWFSLLTTDENLPSNALYTSLGFQAVGHYHYRIKP